MPEPRDLSRRQFFARGAAAAAGLAASACQTEDPFALEKPPVPVPDLSTVVPARDDAFLFSVVRDGGEAVGKSRFMPPFGFQLSDQEVWDLVAYMRSLKGKP